MSCLPKGASYLGFIDSEWKHGLGTLTGKGAYILEETCRRVDEFLEGTLHPVYRDLKRPRQKPEEYSIAFLMRSYAAFLRLANDSATRLRSYMWQNGFLNHHEYRQSVLLLPSEDTVLEFLQQTTEWSGAPPFTDDFWKKGGLPQRWEFLVQDLFTGVWAECLRFLHCLGRGMGNTVITTESKVAQCMTAFRSLEYSNPAMYRIAQAPDTEERLLQMRHITYDGEFITIARFLPESHVAFLQPSPSQLQRQQEYLISFQEKYFQCTTAAQQETMHDAIVNASLNYHALIMQDAFIAAFRNVLSKIKPLPSQCVSPPTKTEP